MTLNEKISEIQIYFNYWIGNYQRKDLTTNNVRIALEAVAKACILKNKGEVNGTNIILGKDTNTPRNRSTPLGKELNLAGSLREAERETGVSHSTISNCAKGIYKQAGGFIWTF